MSRVRNFVFTVNNYTEEEYTSIKSTECTYIILGREVGESGTAHIQGYVEFPKAVTLASLKKRAGFARAHLEPRRGSQTQAVEYCRKDGNFEEVGTLKKQGERTDLAELADRIKEGLTVDELVVENQMAYHQYGRTLTKLEDVLLRKKFRTWMTTCDWYWGETGAGKSHKAFEGFDPDTHYVLRLNDKGWWDGYTGQETVIINEFRGQIMYSELLDLIDRYPKYVPRRGREPVPFLAKHIIITSSMKPQDVYHNLRESDDIAQLMRRVHSVQMYRSGPEGNTDLWT